jgi:hypothetical protein
MQPGGSLLHSQEPTTCPYPEPAQSSPWPPPHFLKVHSNTILPIYAWVFQVVSFLQITPPKSCMHLAFPPHMLHVLPISFLIWSCK